MHIACTHWSSFFKKNVLDKLLQQLIDLKDGTGTNQGRTKKSLLGTLPNIKGEKLGWVAEKDYLNKATEVKSVRLRFLPPQKI